MADHSISALILAGGESRRMGKSKAWLAYHGMPQVLWLHQCLKKHLDAIYISINAWPEEQPPLPQIQDGEAWKDHGPISGILSAFERLNTPLMVIGCDYPFLQENHIAQLLQQRNPAMDATMFRNEDGYYEPLFGIYEIAGLEKLKAHFLSGKDSLSGFLKTAEVQPLTGFPKEVFYSVDTEAAYLEVLQKLHKAT